MDKRLVVELIPGPAFLVGNLLGGLFAGAIFATAATALAILLRWRWDKTLPLMALSIFGLTVVFLTVGLFLNDTTYVKVSNTAGSLAFAAIIGAGLWLRPSLLERTLGYSIHMTAPGWRRLHHAWIALSVVRALANEVMWRSFSDTVWAIYNGVSDVVWIGLFIGLTSLVAYRYWDETAAAAERGAD